METLDGTAAEKALGRRRHPHRHFARMHDDRVTILHSGDCLAALGKGDLQRCQFSRALARRQLDIPQRLTVPVMMLAAEMVVDFTYRPKSNALPDVEAWLED